MKYFVTSSLNIDNILSTESISPISFYQKRSFGYERIEQLSQFTNIDNHILLFSDIPNFSIVDSERENHPLVIQINDEEQLSNALEVGGCDSFKIFAFNNTIHINPTNCKILFFSDKAKVLSKHNCLDSKLNKLINYYKFETIKPSDNQLNDLLTTIDVSKLTNSNVDYKDNLIDRAKGFIYGYYLGASNDLPSDVAEILAKQKRIYDIVAAKINNKSQLSDLFDDELNELDKYLSENDPAKAKSIKLWNEFATKNNLTVEQLNTVLKELDCEIVAKNYFMKQKGIVIYKGKDMFSFNLEGYRQTLDSYIRNLVDFTRNKNITIIDKIHISSSYEFNLKSEDEDANLFNYLLQTTNEIRNIDEVRTNRFDVLQIIGKKISEHFGKESKERNYWFSLASNVIQSSSFDVKEINNIVLQSLAAFVLKGEDYDTLTDYIATNAIPTYRYALAFWGAITGYVNISRPLMEKQINSHFEKLYSDANKLVFGKDLKEKLEYQTPQTIVMPQEDDHETLLTLQQRVNDIIAKHPKIKLSDKEKTAINNAFAMVGNDGIAFIKLIDNDMESLDKGIFPWLQKELYPDYKKPKKTIKKAQSVIEKGKEIVNKTIDFIRTDSNNNGDTFTIGQYFYCDKNVWAHIEPLITDYNAKSKIKSDLEWFQDDITKPIEQRKYYKNLDVTNNKAVIDAFCRLKTGNDKQGLPKAPYFTEELRRKIEHILKELYK